MYFAAAFVASLVVSASALATPQVEGLSRRHHHAALAKRVPAPAPEPVAEPLDASAAVHKKRLRKRCKPLGTSTEAVSSTKVSSSAAAPSSSAAPVNVAPLPISIETTSSSTPAPSPSSKAHSSSSAEVSPSPSQKSPPPPKPSPSPAPAPSSGGSQSSSLFTGTQTGGDGTFYGTGLGACGITNNDSDLIAAAPFDLFDHFPGYDGVNPNKNPICGKKVKVTYQGKSVTVAITDRCAGCFNAKSLDFSPAAFNQIADPSVGRIHDISYTWL